MLQYPGLICCSFLNFKCFPGSSPEVQSGSKAPSDHFNGRTRENSLKIGLNNKSPSMQNLLISVLVSFDVQNKWLAKLFSCSLLSLRSGSETVN